MKIVSWNCGGWSCGGFNINKYNEMKLYQPDILLIQEITKKEFDFISTAINEEREKLIRSFSDKKEEKYFSLENYKFEDWYGDDNEESYKGIAIFSVSCMYNIELIENFNKKFRYVVPYVVKRDDFEFYIFSVWIKPYEKNYVKGIKEYLYASKEYYIDMLDKNAIFIGDFNIYAKDDNDHLKKLEEKMKPMINCTIDTSFHNTVTYYHDEKSGYGINDFCFASESLCIKDVKIEAHDQKYWNGSDHCPIMVEFDI